MSRNHIVLFILLLLYCCNGLKAGTWDEITGCLDSHSQNDTLIYIGTVQFGLSGQLGKVISTANDIPQGATHLRTGGGGGFYILYPLSKKFYVYQQASVNQKGYNINYSEEGANSKYHTLRNVHGYSNMLYFEKSTSLGFNMSPGFSLFAGLDIAFRLRVKMKYDASVTLTDSTRQVVRVVNYPTYNKTGNDAIDLVDLVFVAGLRWNAFNTIGISVRYMRDIAGLNLSTTNPIRNTLINSGLFFVVDIPLFRNKLYYKEDF